MCAVISFYVVSSLFVRLIVVASLVGICYGCDNFFISTSTKPESLF